MPTRADLEAARPKCRAVVALVDGQPGAVCGRPMRYYPGRKVWACPKHGGRVPAPVLVAEQQHGRIV